jgi:hypothetical protein
MLALVGAMAVAAAPAGAQNPPKATGKILGPLHVHGDQASLRVRYRCSQSQAIWVSAKQAASRKRDAALTKEGSSQTAAAWWDSHRQYFRCDGKRHVGTFYVDKAEPGKKGTLRKGWAWIQFCLTVPGATPQDEGTLELSRSRFVRVAVHK